MTKFARAQATCEKLILDIKEKQLFSYIVYKVNDK